MRLPRAVVAAAGVAVLTLSGCGDDVNVHTQEFPDGAVRGQVTD